MNQNSKNKGIKMIAILLVITIIATLLPMRVVVRAELLTNPQAVTPEYDPIEFTDFPTQEGELSNNKIDALFEDTDLRTSNSKTLRLNDGTYTLGSYGFNIHFQTSDGFVEYDNTLIRKDGFYSPTVSTVGAPFSTRITES